MPADSYCINFIYYHVDEVFLALLSKGTITLYVILEPLEVICNPLAI